MSTMALQTLIGTTLIDHKFCEELLDGKRATLLTEFNLTNEEREAILAVKANSTQEFAIELHEWLAGGDGPVHFTSLPGEERGQAEEHVDKDIFLIECLAWGLLRAYGIKGPPVPVREMVKHPLPIFKRLTLLELSLGLYDAAYRPCLDGSRLIVVDPTKPRTIQRTSTARELYVAFCRSTRATELGWPSCEQPRSHSALFARCLLMPDAWVLSACTENISVESLATRFGVPIKTITQRLSEIVYHHQPNLGEPLADALFSLNDPWRDRFLGFVARQATNKVCSRQLPIQEEVITWLTGNPGLYQDVKYMLHTWQKPRLAHQPQ